jgi:hypothetical protein
MESLKTRCVAAAGYLWEAGQLGCAAALHTQPPPASMLCTPLAVPPTAATVDSRPIVSLQCCPPGADEAWLRPEPSMQQHCSLPAALYNSSTLSWDLSCLVDMQCAAVFPACMLPVCGCGSARHPHHQPLHPVLVSIHLTQSGCHLTLPHPQPPPSTLLLPPPTATHHTGLQPTAFRERVGGVWPQRQPRPVWRLPHAAEGQPHALSGARPGSRRRQPAARVVAPQQILPGQAAGGQQLPGEGPGDQQRLVDHHAWGGDA